MRRIVLGFFLSVLATGSAYALGIGDPAPDFTMQAALDGKPFTFALADALKQGPVVVYFYPAAFTKGCTIEAHEFAGSIDKFKAAGATVLGVSHDTIDTLEKFSTSECQGKFPVAADEDQKVEKAYDAILLAHTSYASRTSFVIAPDGKIIERYEAMNPDGHVEKTLAAVTTWQSQHGKSATP
jgi:peroxiredoxin (alkyl hydroperoxide reductase subunit C)